MKEPSIEYRMLHEIISRNITICYRCGCRGAGYEMGHSRAHAHVDERKICLSSKPKTLTTLFTLFHEIGHIVHPKGSYKNTPRWLAEQNATEWARQRFTELHLEVPERVDAEYERYLEDKKARAVRRGADPRQFAL